MVFLGTHQEEQTMHQLLLSWSQQHRTNLSRSSNSSSRKPFRNSPPTYRISFCPFNRVPVTSPRLIQLLKAGNKNKNRNSTHLSLCIKASRSSNSSSSGKHLKLSLPDIINNNLGTFNIHTITTSSRPIMLDLTTSNRLGISPRTGSRRQTQFQLRQLT